MDWGNNAGVLVGMPYCNYILKSENIEIHTQLIVTGSLAMVLLELAYTKYDVFERISIVFSPLILSTMCLMIAIHRSLHHWGGGIEDVVLT